MHLWPRMETGVAAAIVTTARHVLVSAEGVRYHISCGLVERPRNPTTPCHVGSVHGCWGCVQASVMHGTPGAAAGRDASGRPADWQVVHATAAGSKCLQHCQESVGKACIGLSPAAQAWHTIHLPGMCGQYYIARCAAPQSPQLQTQM